MEFLTQNMQLVTAAAIVAAALLLSVGLWRGLRPRLLARRSHRLGITEYYEIDRTRRLVLVRRDNVEHLVMIGPQHDLVIESGISAGSTAEGYSAPATPPAGPAPGSGRPAPRPPVFGDRKPPPPPAAPREEPQI